MGESPGNTEQLQIQLEKTKHRGTIEKKEKIWSKLSLTLPEDLLQFKVTTPAGDGSLQGGLLQQQRISYVFINLHKDIKHTVVR